MEAIPHQHAENNPPSPRGDLKRKNQMVVYKVRYGKSTTYTVSQVEVQEYSQYLLEDVEKTESQFDVWDVQS